MPFVIHCLDRTDGAALRQRLRPSHIEYMLGHLHRQLYGGPLLGPDGMTVGSLMVTDHATRAELDTFLRDEPYARNGLFASVQVHPLRQMVPETAPGFLASELERERIRAGQKGL